MAVARIIETSGTSARSFEEAVRHGLSRIPGGGCNVRDASVKDIRVSTGPDGSVIEWRVSLRVGSKVD